MTSRKVYTCSVQHFPLQMLLTPVGLDTAGCTVAHCPSLATGFSPHILTTCPFPSLLSGKTSSPTVNAVSCISSQIWLVLAPILAFPFPVKIFSVSLSKPHPLLAATPCLSQPGFFESLFSLPVCTSSHLSSLPRHTLVSVRWLCWCRTIAFDLD